MLEDILKSKKCFKLVCGAGNEDLCEVEKLVALYSKAGCRFFDLCAKPEVLQAAKKGLAFSIPQEERGGYYFCISVGIKDDPHVSKAQIDENTCISCGQCVGVCLQKAIFQGGKSYFVDKQRCIGCAKCIKVCHLNCISMFSENKDLKEVLPPLIKEGIDCIELHAMGEDENDVIEKWSDINNMFGGMLSICVGREKLGSEKMISRLKNLIKSRAPYTTIIQADGTPMSGGRDDFNTTLQAVSTAGIVRQENFPAYLLTSGGTNSKTTELAKLCEVKLNGVAIGSFAREIVRKFVEKEDFLTNGQEFEQALQIAKNLVETSLKYL